jgi:hypothetical protein
MPDQTQTQDTKQSPAPGSDEYKAQMAALYDNQGGTKDTSAQAQDFKPQRPEWVEEQFWDAEKGQVNTEALAKSYKELRTKMSSGGAKEGGQQAAQSGDGKPQSGAEQAVAAAGLDFNQLGTKISSAGDIEETDYAALEKVGIPRGEVQNYVRLIKAEAERVKQDAYKEVGGQQNFDAIMAKAKAELSPDEKTALNTLLAGEGTRKAALQTLKQRFMPDDGEPQGQLDGGSPAGGAGGYPSLAQQTAAINDPRYKTDPAYRAQVRQRIALSRF